MVDHQFIADRQAHAVVARRGEVVHFGIIRLQPPRPCCLEVVVGKTRRRSCPPIEIDGRVDLLQAAAARIGVLAEQARRARIKSVAWNDLKRLARAEPVQLHSRIARSLTVVDADVVELIRDQVDAAGVVAGRVREPIVDDELGRRPKLEQLHH